MSIKKFNDFDKTNESGGDVWTKEYVGYWQPGTFQVEEGCSDSQGSEFQIFRGEDDLLLTVNEDNGYDEEELVELSKLNVGEVWEARHYGTSHMIWRVK